ncbi:uncharacterized protein LOC110876323 [Helianthus annuus]|uniref:uncharacterized protein LOC110876323 n=1 Tax=Helianthus annuus TaxID=4232 RepID=UPI000B8F71F2|nr:uncharacterized protein LOC110876323 [Helianthus annuus]
MNFLTANIRGAGDPSKGEHVRNLKRNNKLGFIAIQETQMSDSSNIQVSNFWDNTQFDFDSIEATGRSGRLLSIWDPRIFTKKPSVKNRYFLAILREVGNGVGNIAVVNVYAPQDQNLKKQLWEDLLALMRSFSGSWIFLGDFNCVREPTERKNSRFNKNEADDFNAFINAEGLAEYSMMGCTFTYVTDDGRKLSKIDRVLVCHSFLALWPTIKLWGSTRHKSDHRPLLLLCSDVNFGKPPFRFFNSWLKDEGLHDIVKKAYDGLAWFNPPDKLLAIKLKAVKAAIRPWCDNIKKRNCGMLKDLQKKVETLDLKAESVALTEQEIEDRNSWLKMINELDDNRMEDLKQRAKVKWAVDGDENTAFFHGVINGHRENNRINGLNFEDVWISQPEELKEKIYKHYESIFLEQE